MYEYRPPKDIFSRVLLGALLAAGAGMILAGAALPSGGAFLQTGGCALILAGLLIGSRFVMTRYCYSVEYTDGRPREAGPDLVVTEQRGRRRRVVCRVSVAGGRLVKLPRGHRARKAARGDSAPYFDYSPALLPGGTHYFFPSEEDGGGCLRFSPDPYLEDLLSRADH